MMRIFEFRDPTPIEALVIASDEEAASAIFQMYLRAHGGDPDTLLFRQLQMLHLQDLAAEAVGEALDLGREGLIICDAADQWVFVVPLGDRVPALGEDG